MSKHASPSRRPALTPAVTSVAAIVALTGAALVLHSNSPASASSQFGVSGYAAPAPPATVVGTVDGTVVGTADGAVDSFARTVRAIERERMQDRAQARREARLERRKALELRQERREQARERAARAAERALGRWVWPISGASMSAYFGESGSSWSSGYHTGQDFTAPYGTPVFAASGGTVTFAGWSDAYGNKIEITHPDGNQTWYAHLSSLERTSGTVKPGQVIGYVGCSGNCYGNHLHFEFHPGGGEAADPVSWLRQHGAG